MRKKIIELDLDIVEIEELIFQTGRHIVEECFLSAIEIGTERFIEDTFIFESRGSLERNNPSRMPSVLARTSRIFEHFKNNYSKEEAQLEQRTSKRISENFFQQN